MKQLCITGLLWSLLIPLAWGQTPRLDSLRRLLPLAKDDTSRVWVLTELGAAYRVVSPDLSLRFAQQALTLSRKIGFVKGEIRALSNLGRVIQDKGNLPKALQYQLDALKLAERNNLPSEMAWPMNRIGSVYGTLGNYQKTLYYSRRAMQLFKANRDEQMVAVVQNNIALSFLRLNQPDSALAYANSAYRALSRISSSISPILLVYNALGQCYAQKHNTVKAMSYFRQGIQLSTKEHDHRNKSQVYSQIASLYQNQNQPDSCIYYAQKALDEATFIGYRQGILQASVQLAESFRLRRNFERAFIYQQMMVAAQDSLFSTANVQAIEQLVASEQKRQREAEAQIIAYQNQMRQYALLASLGTFLLIALILYRNNRQKHRANQLLNEQKAKVEQSLETLKTTQNQLIQKEKMASLGELTAGIAHEIQNPLNFVNNFAEVSTELVGELKDEINRGDTDEAQAIADDLSQNLQKIYHHGQRASGIVKGMLEHSRASTGQKEPTDLNALAQEYLNLAYQGMRAKNKVFSCALETHLDPNLPLVSVVAQDMSRVLLNLYNNALYAVQQKQKTAGADYQPSVCVTTQQQNGQVLVQVRDNGIGIPDAVKQKIFQPFFTTKPTGEGTGLGLSLSYDIVTKGHGGTLTVESQEGQGTQFAITLPFLN